MAKVDFRSSLDVSRPLAPNDARRLARVILQEGHSLSFSDHAVEELEADDMDMLDVTNVIRCAHRCDPAERHERTSTWTYRLHTQNMCVLVSFPSTSRVRIVTAWRTKRRE